VLRRLRDRFRLGSKRTTKEGRPVENVDATAAAAKHGSDLLGPVSGYPPGYVKGYDEGRPRH
jgi:hypothetical protein